MPQINSMTVPKNQSLKEQAWADELPDPEEETNETEPTYRDGSVQNECWAEDGYTREP